MKRVLFVGDGKHDIGAPDWPSDEPFPARGVVPTLAQKVVPIDTKGSLALPWSRIARFSAKARSGYPAKLAAARLLAERVYNLDGVVAVVDEDNDPARRRLPDTAQQTLGCPVVCGVAVRSIEAWTLGALTALAHVLGTNPKQMSSAYTVRAEEFYDGSGKPELRSKTVLNSLAQQHRHQPDSLVLREEVAEHTDIDELCRSCPTGFAPFTAALRATFGAAPPR